MFVKEKLTRKYFKRQNLRTFSCIRLPGRGAALVNPNSVLPRQLLKNPLPYEREASNMLFLLKYRKAAFPAIVLFLIIFGKVAFGGDFLHYDSDISGKIVNFDTHEPMEGVVVSCVWFYEQFRLTEASKKEFFDYYETLTDQDGSFRIPGRGISILRKIYPPSIIIFKAGYSVLRLRELVPNERQLFPSSEEVNWIDGKVNILFRKKTLEERIKYLESDSAVPLFQMMRDDFPVEKVQLYVRECEKEYKAAGMQENYPPLLYKEGGVFPF